MTAAARKAPARRAKSAPAKNPVRAKLIGKVKVAQKQLGLDDDTYRDLLTRVTGKDSAKACSISDLEAVVREFVNLGWTPKRTAPARSGKPRPMASSETAAKARALWLSLYHLGVVRDPSERALNAFAKRQTGMADLRWVREPRHVSAVVDALKAMGERDAGVQWGRYTTPAEAVVAAQWQALQAVGTAPAASFLAWAAGITGKAAPFAYEDKDWDALIAALGEPVRALKGDR